MSALVAGLDALLELLPDARRAAEREVVGAARCLLRSRGKRGADHESYAFWWKYLAEVNEALEALQLAEVEGWATRELERFGPGMQVRRAGGGR